MKNNVYTFLLFATFFSFSVSCAKKSSEELSGDSVPIEVTLSGEEIIDAGEISPSGTGGASSRIGRNSGLTSEIGTLVHADTVPFAEGFDIVSELHVEKPASSLEQTMSMSQKAANSKKAVVTTTDPILRQIKFVLLVFNNSGNYVTSKDYQVSATGAVTPIGVPLSLPAGTYRFVAISRNTNTAPSISVANINDQVTFDTDGEDLMWYRSGIVTVAAGSIHYLNVILQHRLTRITVRIDATATNGYTISQIGQIVIGNPSPLGIRYPTANLNLSTGVKSAGGARLPLEISQSDFTGLGTSVVTSPSYSVNNPTVTTTFRIASLTVGPLSRTFTVANPAFSGGAVLEPSGHRYVLLLRVIPTDQYRTIAEVGYPAATIGGTTWMLHNLGANTSRDVTGVVSGSLQDLMGNYYQWGNQNPAILSDFTPGSTWNTSNDLQPSTAWNLGTNTIPQKSTLDPCPTGWRVPTLQDWQDLIDNTQYERMGISPYQEGQTVYTNAGILRSNRNYNVKLIFPMAGYYVQSGTVTNVRRGVEALYWASTVPVSPTYAADRALFTAGRILGNITKQQANSLRCVRE